jgi:LysM repeat protein
MPGIADNCDGFYKVLSGDQCGTIATKHGISEAQFKSWNSQVNDSTPLSSPFSLSIPYSANCSIL